MVKKKSYWKKIANTKNNIAFEKEKGSGVIFIFKDIDTKKWILEGNRTGDNLYRKFKDKSQALMSARLYMRKNNKC